MTIVAWIVSTLLALAAGFGVLALLSRPGMTGRGFYEQTGLSYFVGIVYLASVGLLFGRFKIPVTFWTLAASVALPAVVVAIALFRRGVAGVWRLNMRPGSLVRNRWWQWALLALIAIKLAYILTMNLTELRRTDDAFKCWLVLAKHVHYDHTPSEYELPGNYPKLNGMVIYWFGGSLGRWDEFQANLAYFNYVLFFLLLFYANLRARTDKGTGLIGAYMLAGFPVLLGHAVLVGYADLPMSIFLTLVGVYAYRYACDGRRDDLALAAFFLFVLPQIKNEGLVPYFPLGFYTLLVAWLWRRERPRPAVIWAATGGLVVAGFAVVLALQAVFGDAGPPRIADLIHWGAFRPGNHWREVQAPLFAHFGFEYNNWMLAGALAPLSLPFLVLRFRKRPEAVVALHGILLLIAFVYLFCFSVAYEWLVQGTTVNRSYLQIVPTFLFAALTMLGRWSLPPSAAE